MCASAKVGESQTLLFNPTQTAFLKKNTAALGDAVQPHQDREQKHMEMTPCKASGRGAKMMWFCLK